MLVQETLTLNICHFVCRDAACLEYALNQLFIFCSHLVEVDLPLFIFFLFLQPFIHVLGLRADIAAILFLLFPIVKGFKVKAI